MISVIVPVYNVEKYIHRCIDSILAQTFTDFELILVDDGSPDNCGKICDEYAEKDDRIHVIHKENGGLSSARNAGLDWIFANSDSEWVTFIDSDDWVHSQYLEALLFAAEKQSLQISSMFLVRVSKEKDIIEHKLCNFDICVEDAVNVYTQFGTRIECYAPGRLYYKLLWKNVRFPIGMLWEDVATTYKVLLQVQNIAVVNESLYYYYINNEGITKQSWTIKRLDEIKAYELLMNDEIIKRNKRIVPLLREQYIGIIHYQIVIAEQATIDKSIKKSVVKKLRKKLRFAVSRYSAGTKYDFKNSKKTFHIFETAYPVEMQFYWYWKALKNKVKGRIK